MHLMQPPPAPAAELCLELRFVYSQLKATLESVSDPKKTLATLREMRTVLQLQMRAMGYFGTPGHKAKAKAETKPEPIAAPQPAPIPEQVPAEVVAEATHAAPETPASRATEPARSPKPTLARLRALCPPHQPPDTWLAACEAWLEDPRACPLHVDDDVWEELAEAAQSRAYIQAEGLTPQAP